MAITLQRTARFEREYRGLEEQVREDVDRALVDLFDQNAAALRQRRNHQLHGYKNPRISKIDVRSDKSYQLTYDRDGETLTLRRISTHKEIDRSP